MRFLMQRVFAYGKHRSRPNVFWRLSSKLLLGPLKRNHLLSPKAQKAQQSSH